MKKLIVLLMLLNVGLFAQTITIAVAANVSYAIDPLVKEFNKTNPDTNVQVVLGSSGKLSAQIKNGAPFDLFLAADMEYPQSLYDDKLAINKPVIYAQGAVALLTTKELDLKNGLEILNNATVKKIAIANPKTAPYGKAALEAMEKLNIYDSVKDKFVYAESISQAVTYTLTACEVGFVAKSALYANDMANYKEGINWIEIDSKLYTPINQGLVILKKAENNSEAKAFYDFILSKDAKIIFEKFGYIVP